MTDRHETTGWRSYMESPPPPGVRHDVAHEPNRITQHEPRPLAWVLEEGSSELPGWFNVAGLLWRPARAR
jgi:hypothetical protein